MGCESGVQRGQRAQEEGPPGGPQLTSTLLSHGRTATKDCLAVRSYMTTTPSALRKNCRVMQRYLREGPGHVRGLLCRHSPPPRGEERRGYPGGGGVLTSPAPPCPTAAGPPASRPRSRSSRGNRCLRGEPSIMSKSGSHAPAWNPISPRGGPPPAAPDRWCGPGQSIGPGGPGPGFWSCLCR